MRIFILVYITTIGLMLLNWHGANLQIKIINQHRSIEDILQPKIQSLLSDHDINSQQHDFQQYMSLLKDNSSRRDKLIIKSAHIMIYTQIGSLIWFALVNLLCGYYGWKAIENCSKKM